jgi:hypothetical protein
MNRKEKVEYLLSRAAAVRESIEREQLVEEALYLAGLPTGGGVAERLRKEVAFLEHAMRLAGGGEQC